MGREAALARLKGDLRAGKTILGMHHISGSEPIIELLAFSGFDFVVIDMEHTAYTLLMVEGMVRTAEAADIVAFIRVLKNDPHLIMQALETGAQGVVVPHVRSRRDCADAMAAMRFPPKGIRGWTAGTRAGRWGSTEARRYQEWSNAEPMLIPLIEDREAMDNIEEILSVPGLELICIGPGDLSQAYGAPGMGLRAEPVMEALERAIRLCAPLQISVMTLPIPDLTNEWAREIAAKGARAIWYSSDLLNIGHYFRHIAQTKD